MDICKGLSRVSWKLSRTVLGGGVTGNSDSLLDKAEGKIKQPYYISLKSGEPMAMGGLWESWKDKDGNVLRTVCVVTTSPNTLMEPIHDRMPVIVAPDNWQSWLSGLPEEVAGMVAPYRDEELQAWPVSRRVSKTQDDDAGLIEPLEVPA